MSTLQSDGNTLTVEEDVDFEGRDQVPQRMVSDNCHISSQHCHLHYVNPLAYMYQ